MPAILVCIAPGEVLGPALAEAGRLSSGRDAALSIIEVHPKNSIVPATTHPGAWHLRTDEPPEALARFAKRNRITHVILGREGWRLWGTALATALTPPAAVRVYQYRTRPTSTCTNPEEG